MDGSGSAGFLAKKESSRKKDFKKGLDAEKLNKLRSDRVVKIRKDKREDRLNKRRRGHITVRII